MAGPENWFTGAVYVNAVAAPGDGSRVSASSVHFTPGARVFFEPGEEHWHGASPDRFMTHLAMLQVDEEGTSAAWGEHVTDEEYTSHSG